MRLFDIDGKKYVQINGKTFYLLRGYRIRYDKFVFVQVYGTAALTKDDLPEKNWDVRMTKDGGRKVYTAWKPSFFDGCNETRLFVGVTAEAGVRLLLHAHGYTADADRAIRALFSEECPPFHSAGIDKTQDDGNAGIPAFALNRPYSLPHWIKDLPKEDA